MAGLPSFFKTPRHRSFDYKPMYYDEQEECRKELEMLVEEQRSGVISDERRLERLRGKMNSRWSGSRANRKQQTFNQKLRLIAILAVLVGLVWFFFNWA
jgi:hypothetical protein